MGSVRIGVIASIAHRLPPTSYGPWEQIASTLTEGFVARGHDVTLFATADSATSATLCGTAPAGYEEDPSVDAKVWEGLHNAAVFERADRFDVIANHFDFMPLTYSRLVGTPMVTTVHGFSSPAILPVYQRYDDIAHYVSISDADRSPLLHYARHHPSRDRAEPFHVRPRARHVPAVPRPDPPRQGSPPRHSRRSRGRSPSRHRGIVQDHEYFTTMVRPHVDGQAVSYLGPVGPTQRDALLGGAMAVLHLVDFDEPFGLSVVEALATGTPIIASPRGSLPEIVQPAVTGFLVTGHTAAVHAVARLEEIDRGQCRSDAETRFSADRMVEDYLALFERLRPTR